MKRFQFSPSFISKIALLALLASAFGQIGSAYAASYSSMKDTLTRLKESTAATHSISFTNPTTIAAGKTITITFPSDFAVSSAPTGGTGLGTSPSFAFNATGPATMSVTCGTGGCPSGAITITGGIATNASTPGSYSVDISNDDNSDTGTFAIAIVDDDQVSITASVDPSITFDIDTATTNTDTNPPYTVALGTLTTSAVNGSDHTSVNSIWLDLNTNASSGAVVTVSSANQALTSGSDSIPSATAAMAAGTANYGVCVISATATTGTLNKVSPYNGTCSATPASNSVGALPATASPANIINTNSLPVAAGRVEIAVDAAISGVTPAHPDYADTQQYIATGTF